ncbi:MAG: quinolinate synthase [Candidatus Omnitrophica bacterium CG11_big_fil_rev_8_21_14_0_20_42_13]|uniref:Quinolinate synthase n=1 Tax=Candidatus Ghiorseimicrobium undicola TaxID=1974746 RepID=A0A2H0LWV8_9BACT|nr:MAG: quinolinate synthase [Candidatus Omnitrophica bacterium CG11_big_fil_rev_8_21_14_0_20_42_13]
MKKIIKEINKLRKDRNAIILAHNYQLPEVQDVADYRGDSLELSRIAASTSASVVVFCGVHFMAETASILCPDKKVLIPDARAGCPMANMITPEDLIELKARHPKAVTVGYVNTSAAVKAELDICCTSTNAVDLILKLKHKDEIIFIPDKYLADYVSKKTGRRLISWDGYCPTHVKILPEDIIRQIRAHPQAKVLVHPECTPEVILLADEVLSTGKMYKYVKDSSAKEFIIGTEVGIIYRLKCDNPSKSFYPASELAVCPNMKKINLEKVLWSLEDLKEEVKVPEDIRKKAIRPIEKMLSM